MTRTPLGGATALTVLVAAALGPASASAADACRGNGVPFTTKGEGRIVTVSGSDGAEAPFEGRVLSFRETYRAIGVTVTFSHKSVRYTVAPGSTFKPGCFTTTATGVRNSLPGPYLTRGRIDVSGSRTAPLHGVNTFEGVFYTRRRTRTRFTVRRSYRGERQFQATSTLSVSRGGPLTLTPYSDIAKPHSCRNGRSLSITSSGRIRGG